MTTGIDLLENIYQQLRNAGLVASKGDFSDRLLAKSRSYLTSMRARNRCVANETIMALGTALKAEIGTRNADHEVTNRIVLRRATKDIDDFLGDYPIIAMLNGNCLRDGTSPNSQQALRSTRSFSPRGNSSSAF